jgi:hypothetical protein
MQTVSSSVVARSPSLTESTPSCLMAATTSGAVVSSSDADAGADGVAMDARVPGPAQGEADRPESSGHYFENAALERPDAVKGGRSAARRRDGNDGRAAARAIYCCTVSTAHIQHCCIAAAQREGWYAPVLSGSRSHSRQAVSGSRVQVHGAGAPRLASESADARVARRHRGTPQALVLLPPAGRHDAAARAADVAALAAAAAAALRHAGKERRLGRGASAVREVAVPRRPAGAGRPSASGGWQASHASRRRAHGRASTLRLGPRASSVALTSWGWSVSMPPATGAPGCC